jgi:hypothetical protein
VCSGVWSQRVPARFVVSAPGPRDGFLNWISGKRGISDTKTATSTTKDQSIILTAKKFRQHTPFSNSLTRFRAAYRACVRQASVGESASSR